MCECVRPPPCVFDAASAALPMRHNILVHLVQVKIIAMAKRNHSKTILKPFQEGITHQTT